MISQKLKHNLYFLIAVSALSGFVLGVVSLGGSISESFRSSMLSSFQAQTIGIGSNYLENISRNKISLLFVGDIMLSRGVNNQIQNNGNDYLFPFRNSAEFLDKYDAVVGNLEGPISDRGNNQGSIYSFRDNPKVVDGIKYANIKVLSLANNHMFDWGTTALLDTVSILKSAGIKTAGAGDNYDSANEPAIINVKGTKIAFFSYTNLYPLSLDATQSRPGISAFDANKLREKISQLKSENLADLAVVSFHWGVEYSTTSNPLQEKLAHEIIDAGADVVIGHHPHVVQESEIYKGKPIFYSLGNFVFDQPFSKETMSGLAAEITISKNKITGVGYYKTSINSKFQPSIGENKISLQ